MSSGGNAYPVEPLTQREQDVLELLAQDKSNRQMAAALVLSLHTIKWYNRQIYGKLGVENREEAVARARALGLVAAEEEQALPQYHLPVVARPLIGRERELEELTRLLLDRSVRVVSLVGPGGIGKTRLALEVASELSEKFKDGAAFVSLAPLSNAEAVVPAVAQAVRFALQPGDRGDPKEQLLAYFRWKKLLLVLDNFEHLTKARPLLTEIVRAAPAIKLLITSRERLNLQVEQIYPLQGLRLIQWKTMEEAQKDPLVRLFLYHAHRVRPSFTLRLKHLEPLQELFRLVGGMPLAVILAAGWVQVLSPAEIVAEISRNLDFLEATSYDIPARHQSVRAVFEGTWTRLNEEEQRLYAALSIFRGGFTVEAAREVAGASPRDLMWLVERSLLTRVEGSRFEQHELLRQYAAQELARNPQEERAFCGRHSAFYCRFMAAREPDLKGPRALEAEAEIAVDYENVRTAWKWAAVNLQEKLLRQAAPGLGVYHILIGGVDYQDAAALFRQARETSSDAQIFSLHTQAMLLSWNSVLLSSYKLLTGLETEDEQEQLARQALSYLDKAAEKGEDVRATRALALMALGFSFSSLGRFQSSAESLEASLALYSELGRLCEMGFLHDWLGHSYMQLGEYRLSREHFHKGQHLYEIVGLEEGSNLVKLLHGWVSVTMGQLENGEATVREALAWFQEKGRPEQLAKSWVRLGSVLIYLGRFQEARAALATNRPTPETSLYYYSVMLELWAKMHLGQYEQVQQEWQPFLAASRRRQIRYQVSFSSIMLGYTALALKQLEAAESHLQESVTLSGSAGNKDELGWAQAGLGYAALGRGDLSGARDHLVQAMHIASDHELLFIALTALPAVALLMADLGDVGRAVELYALTSRYAFVANSSWFEDVAGQRIAHVADILPAANAADARARGEALDLWQTVDEVLQELELRGMAL